ncbi:MAG: hypothetical protein DRG87_08315 [Deltaproteobacteria bacterium]|nr:MAG: hypothetical protein DRG87_08315 [Deltaproteobacteria bacterium]
MTNYMMRHRLDRTVIPEAINLLTLLNHFFKRELNSNKAGKEKKEQRYPQFIQGRKGVTGEGIQRVTLCNVLKFFC